MCLQWIPLLFTVGLYSLTASATNTDDENGNIYFIVFLKHILNIYFISLKSKKKEGFCFLCGFHLRKLKWENIKKKNKSKIPENKPA